MKKFTSFTIIMVFCLPCLVSAYYILDQGSPPGGFLPNMWANTPITLNIDAGTLAGGNGRTIVEDGCVEWDSVPTARKLCGNLITSSVDITASNFASNFLPGVLTVVFDETGNIFSDGGIDPSTIFGICMNDIDATTGEILRSIMILNGSPLAPQGDILATTIHEFGHCWGLAHIPIGGINTTNSVTGLDPIEPSKIPTMFPFDIPVNDAFGRTLEDDDKAGITVLYPQN